MSAISSHPPDTPGRAPVLDSLFEAPRSAAARVCPRRRQPRWWNDDCFHALIAKNGSWRDFRSSGSEDDLSRFRVMRQQFHRIVRHSTIRLLGRLVLQGTVSLPLRSQARFSPHPSDIPFYRSSLLIYATCSGQVRIIVLCSLSVMHWPSGGLTSLRLPPALSFRTTSSFLSPAVSLHSHLSTTPASSDALFSYSELVAALSKCHESVPIADLLPFSVFKVHFP